MSSGEGITILANANGGEEISCGCAVCQFRPQLHETTNNGNCRPHHHMKKKKKDKIATFLLLDLKRTSTTCCCKERNERREEALEEFDKSRQCVYE